MDSSVGTVLIIESIIGLTLADCPYLRPPSYGILDRSCGTRVGNICRIHCKINCQLVGDPVHQCLSNNTWSGSQTYCIDKRIHCRHGLTAPNNGYQVGDCYNRVGCICVFGCNTGYTIVGPSQVTCQRNGQWSAIPSCALTTTITTTTTTTPTTTTTDDSVEHSENHCPALPVPTNGYQRGSCNVVPPGSVCRFGCNTGFQLSGEATRVCKRSGRWTNSNVQCTRVQTKCPTLSPPANGAIYGYCNPGFLVLKCNFVCNKGYRLVGSSSLTCQSNGVWSSTPPVCTTG